MLEHHVDVAVFLSAQVLAPRGHDESRLSTNRGNLFELLEILVDFYSDLRSFLDNDRVTHPTDPRMS